MMIRLNNYVKDRFREIEWYASLIGAAGLGYLILFTLKCAVPLAMGLVFFAACVKTYLGVLVDGRPIVPSGKSVAYRVVWWFLACLVFAFVILSAIACLFSVWATAFD
jgi:hypothetical protein